MTDLITMTDDQFDKLLDRIRATPAPAAAAGLGATPPAGLPQGKGFVGLGCAADAGLGVLGADVYTFLAAGYPRLALAKAMGIPMAPYTLNVRATFSDTSVSVVADVGSDVKITQDTIVESMVVRVENQSSTANQNIFQPQSDWYFGFMSSIEATLDVQGTPRYTVAPNFTPLSNLMDAFNGDARAGAGWVLTYTNQLKMSFQAKVTLPYAPIEVVCTFRCRLPIWDELVQMSNMEALRRLVEDCGVQLTETYKARCCR